MNTSMAMKFLAHQSAVPILGRFTAVMLIAVIASLFLCSCSENQSDSPAEMTVSADQLAQDFKNNGVNADSKYTGKRILVSGTVGRVDNGLGGGADVTLTENTEQIRCHFDDKSAVTSLTPGQQVNITGTCKGLVIYIELDDCSF